MKTSLIIRIAACVTFLWGGLIAQTPLHAQSEGEKFWENDQFMERLEQQVEQFEEKFEKFEERMAQLKSKKSQEILKELEGLAFFDREAFDESYKHIKELFNEDALKAMENSFSQLEQKGTASQKVNAKKEYKNSYSVNKSDRLIFDSAWGDVTVSFWDKPTIEIQATVSSKHPNARTAKEYVEGLVLNTYKSKNRIVWELKNTNEHMKNPRLTVDCRVMMPSTLDSDMSLKYGNLVFNDTYNGRGDFELKYTNLKGKNFTKELELEIKYGNVHIDDFTVADIEAGYGTIKAGNGKKLELEAKYCDGNKFGHIGELSIESKYSSWKIASVNKLKIDMKYSTLDVDKVKQSLVMESSDYSTLNLKELSPDFSRVHMVGRYATIKIGVPSEAAFMVESDKIKYGKFDVKGFSSSKNVSGAREININVNQAKDKRIIFDGDKYSNVYIRAVKP